MPKSERNPNAEIRFDHYWQGVAPFAIRALVGFRISAFGLLPGLLCALWFACLSVCSQDNPRPLTRVHAHNDYEHKRPLLDALDHGFCSVEADIYLVDGQLLVAHMRKDVKPTRTLEKLYLEPLRERVKQNHGHVYPGGPEVTLLIDIKTDWKTTYTVLRETLKTYSDILSTFQNDTKNTNAIVAIITGDRSKTMFAGEITRYAALDGELDDLN